MGRPPAVVIVVRYAFQTPCMLDIAHTHFYRHGARLDAADTQWHLTSPIPYDSPLTYGGWRQSQALGAKIASIIQSREAEPGWHNVHTSNGAVEAEGNGAREERYHEYHSPRTRRRRHKVVVHSSPFLRCVQTSIAISAGMAQYRGESKASANHSHSKSHAMHSGSPHLHGMEDGTSRQLSAIPEPECSGIYRRRNRSQGSRKIPRTLLRVDPFLGEWLSPEYFDKITPPPESKLMVASAKGELLRQGDPIDMLHIAKRTGTARANLLWGGGASSTRSYSSDEDSPLNDMSSLSKNMPRLGRTNSNNVGSPSTTLRSSMRLTTRGDRSPNSERSYYVPPTPSYAVSPSQPIPQGYVAHARDACVNVDTQWDSLRPPLEWGHGGEYGEEWSNMHRRFRHGLHEMILWYRSHEPSETLEPISDGSPQSQTTSSSPGSQDTESSASAPASRASDACDGDDIDTVLVLVTHGAGCNALIGALTNQPVLLDVGMASLTMAVRKSIDYKRVAPPASSTPKPSSRRRQSAIDLGLAEDYDMKIVASTDHLRPGSPFLTGPKVQLNHPVREKSPYRYERPTFTGGNFSASSTLTSDHHDESDGSESTPTSSRPEGLQKCATTAVHPSGGLWTKPEPKKADTATRNGNTKSSIAPVPLYGLDGTASKPRLEQVKSDPTNGDHGDKGFANGDPLNGNNQGRSIIPNGLWGAPPQALATERDTGAKRRWTLSQAS